MSSVPSAAEMSWTVTLTSGDVMTIYAFGTYEEGLDQVFEVLAGGRPPQRVTCARVPLASIEGLLSGIGSEKIDQVLETAAYPVFAGKWTLTCEGGHVVTIWADETHVDGEGQVFTMGVGSGRSEQTEFARFPRRLIVALERESAR